MGVAKPCLRSLRSRDMRHLRRNNRRYTFTFTQLSAALTDVTSESVYVSASRRKRIISQPVGCTSPAQVEERLDTVLDRLQRTVVWEQEIKVDCTMFYDKNSTLFRTKTVELSLYSEKKLGKATLDLSNYASASDRPALCELMLSDDAGSIVFCVRAQCHTAHSSPPREEPVESLPSASDPSYLSKQELADRMWKHHLHLDAQRATAKEIAELNDHIKALSEENRAQRLKGEELEKQNRKLQHIVTRCKAPHKELVQQLAVMDSRVAMFAEERFAIEQELALAFGSTITQLTKELKEAVLERDWMEIRLKELERDPKK